jgi:micrococcal nuclease
MKWLNAALSIYFAFSFSINSFASSFTGKVVGVSDGDTISVMHEGKAERIRLSGIDCPEKVQAFGAKAKQFTSSMCFGKEVTVKVLTKDRYGRTIGEVFLLDSKSLNSEIVRSGYAWWYRQYSPHDKKLEKLEKEAKGSRKGLWIDKNPVPPWTFRRNPSAYTIGEYKEIPNSHEVNKSHDQTLVYATKTGSKYHRASCRFLANRTMPMNPSTAKKRYSPCNVCKPQ